MLSEALWKAQHGLLGSCETESQQTGCVGTFWFLQKSGLRVDSLTCDSLCQQDRERGSAG